MLEWSINLFRIRGIQLSLHYSFVLLLAWAGYEGYQDGGIPGMGWTIALLLAFFTCIVLHELGHSFTARRFGVGVRRILLMPIGGMAEFERIPREPRQEILITIAGPAVNFLIAGVLWLVLDPASAPPAQAVLPSSLSELGWILFSWNIYIGLFNLVPVFPMDGGRILRALLAKRLSYVRATFWAATIGKILSGLGAVLALLVFHNVLLAALFAFIFMAGGLEYRAVRIREQQDAYWETIRTRLQAAGVSPPANPEEPPLLDPN
jgi:Zn-dependent protease